MANLIPYKKSNSSIIKTDKLVTSSFLKKDAKIIAGKNADENILLSINSKAIKVDKLLKNSLLISKKVSDKKRKTSEQDEFKNREKELEKQKPQAIKGIQLPSPPRLGLFDWIKNFVFNTFLGFIAVRLIDHLPKLIQLAPIIFKVGDFLIDMGGKLLDGLVTFVDKAYDVVDNTRKFTKMLGGDGLAQNFDKFSGALSGMLDVAIIAAMSAASMGDDFGGPGGGGRGGRGGRGGIFGRGLGRSGTRIGLKLVGKSGVKAAVKILRPFTKAIPIIGGLLEFGLSLMEGDNVGKALFKAAGSTLFGAIGAALGGPFALFTGGAGAWLGGEAAGRLYDYMFNNKAPQGKTARAAGGGRPATRGGKLVGGPAKRTVSKKKTPRTLKVTPNKLRPGSSVGGEKNIKKIFPEPIDKRQMSPYNFIKNSYNNFSKSSGLGALAALALKPLMGDKPTAVDYKNAGIGVNNWMNTAVGSGTLAYAGGGEVKMESIISGEDYSNVIAKSLQDSVAPQVDKTIQDLMKQLTLMEFDRKPGKDYVEKDEPPDSLEVGPGGTVTGGNADFWSLVAIASLESGNAQGRADVAQSIYNRLASGIYSGRTIKELIVSGNGRQYQPVGRAVREFRAISDRESAIHAIMKANKLNRSQAEKFINETAAAIQNKSLQQSAAQFVGGRTDFWAEGLTPPANGVGYVVRSGHRFGWFVGPAAIAYGKKNPGPAKAPALGDIVIHGGGGGGPVGKGQVNQWLHGNPNRPGYDAGHAGQSNAHDHFSFKSRSAAVAAFKALQASGYKPYEFEGFTKVGKHSPTGGHYGPVGGKPTYGDTSDGTAFDIPWATYGSGPIGKRDYDMSYKAAKIVGAAFHGMNKVIPQDGLLRVHKGEILRVVDKDSVDLFGKEFIQDIIDIENKSQLIAKAPSIIEKLRAISGYTDYERSMPEFIEVPVYIEVEKLVPVRMGGGLMISGGGIDNTYDTLEII
jgi:hypothetical protein